jgi:hypothetical protein
MGEAGVIRFVRMTCFLEFGSFFFVRKAIISGTFSPKAHAIRFVGLPSILTSGEGRRTNAVKPEMIRFVKMTVFSGVQ